MLKELIEKIKENPIYFTYYDQECNDVQKKIQKTLKTKFIPSQILEFYSEIDGITLTSSEIFSIEEIKVEMKENFKEFLESAGYTNDDKYIPIADDGIGGYYCFKSEVDDDTIYYLDKDGSDKVFEFEDFEEFLEQIYKMECDEEESGYNEFGE